MRAKSGGRLHSLLVIPCVLALFADLFAGVDVWTGSESLVIAGVTLDAGSGVLYLSSRYGLFRTEDYGWSVTALTRGLPASSVVSFAMDPSNPSRLWAGFSYQGLFHSTDGGRDWKRLMPETSRPPTALTIDPSAPNTLYGIDNDGLVIKSTDAGQSWKPVLGDELDPIISLAIEHDGSRILAGGNGVWSSVDGGQSWDKIIDFEENVRANAILLHPALPSTILVGSSRGVHKSTDSGKTWQVYTTGLTPAYDPAVWGLFACPHDPSLLFSIAGGGLHRSTDGGESWQLLRKGLVDVGALSLAADPRQPYVFYLGTGTGLFVSNDGGLSWHPAHRSIADFTVANLTVSPDGKVLFAVDSSAPKKSTDGGYTWTPIDAGLPGGSVISDFQIDPTDPAIMYAGLSRGGGFYRTLNGGVSWHALGAIPSEKLENEEWQISVDPFDGCNLFAVQTREGSWDPSIPRPSFSPRLLRSTDRGDSWQPLALPEGPIGATLTRVVFDPGPVGLIYISTRYGVHKSDNYGTTWTPGNQPRAGEPSTLVIDPHQPNVLYAGYETGSIYKSVDGGASWRVSSSVYPHSPILSIEISPHDSRRLYARSAWDGLFVSEDGGATWRRDEHYHVPLRFDPVDPNVIYGGGFWKSTDGGQSWRRLRHDLRGVSVARPIIDPENGDIVYALVWQESVYKTTDGAKTWAAADAGLGPEPWGIVLHPADSRRLWCWASDGLYRTKDGAVNWERVSERFLRRAVVDPGNVDVLYGIGEEPGLLKSADAGRTWDVIADFQVKHFEVCYSAPEVLYAAGYSTLQKSFDAGDTWLDLGWSTLAPGLVVGDVYVDPDNPNVVSVTGYEPVPPGPPGLPSFPPVPPAFKVFESGDGGLTWTELQEPADPWPFYDPHNPRTRYLGDQYSVDGGATWTRLDPPAPYYWSFSISSTEPRKAYARGERGIYELTLSEEKTSYFPQLASGRSGKGNLQTEVALLNTGSESVAYLDFFGRDGEPMPVFLRGLGRRSSFALPLAQGQAITLVSEPETELQLGYLRMQAGARVQGNVIYGYAEKGVRLFEASVPPSAPAPESTFFVDWSQGGDNTGLALVNTGDGNATVRLRLYDQDYRLVASAPLEPHVASFGPGHSVALLASDLFPVISDQNDFKGIITVESDQPLAALSVLQHADPGRPFPLGSTTLTSMPTLPGRPGSGGGQLFFPRIVYLPQIAVGEAGGMQTRSSLFAVNLSSTPVRMEVRLFDGDRNPMAVEIEGVGTASSFDITLARGQSKVLEMASDADQKVGYAVVSCYGNIGITALIDGSQGGLPVFRTGVPAAPGLRRFAIMVRAGEADATALSLVNTGRREANGSLLLRDASGEEIARKTISELGRLSPGAHLARYTFEVFRDLGSTGSFEGSLWIDSDQPLAPVTLRQHDDPLVPFPLDVFLLTIFPVMPR